MIIEIETNNVVLIVINLSIEKNFYITHLILSFAFTRFNIAVKKNHSFFLSIIYNLIIEFIASVCVIFLYIIQH